MTSFWIDFLCLAGGRTTSKADVCLGLIAQYESISAADLIKLLNLKNRNELSPWFDKLVDDGIVETQVERRERNIGFVRKHSINYKF